MILNNKHRVLSVVLLMLVMMLSFASVVAFADDGNSTNVAKVGNNEYATLAKAIAAAKDGETVTLLADATEDVTINKNITLDLGSKALTNTNSGKATITIANGATVTVKNGNVVGGKSYYNIAIGKAVKSTAKLTLGGVTATAGNTGSSMIDNWGTLTINSGDYSGGLNVVKSEEGSTLVINGGKFTLDYATSGYTGVILSAGITTISGGEFIQNATTPSGGNPQVVLAMQVDGYTSKIEITGGTFTNKKFGSTIFHGYGKATSDNFEVSGGTFNKSISDGFCADGFIPTKNADGTYGVASPYEAKIDSTVYETLDAAIAAANKSSVSKTIKLLADLTVDHQILIKNDNGKAITLDLGGKTLTSTLDANGYSLRTDTKVTIKNGTYKGTGNARGIGAYADFVLDGVKVDVAGLVGVACSTGGKTYEIKNSEVKAGYAVCNFADNATITISGSKLTGTGNVLYHNGSNYGLKLTVSNSTITGNGNDCCGVYISGSTSAQANATNQNGAGGLQQATFTKCTIKGANGIEVKYTDLTLDGCTVETTLQEPSYAQNNNGPAANGFAVVSTDNSMSGNLPKPESKIIIKGEGTYTGHVGLASIDSFKKNYPDFSDESIKISGGSFTKKVLPEYCAEGFEPAENGDGTYGVKVAPVAKIGAVEYTTLNEAFAAAKDGDTITIVRNFTTDVTKTTAADRATVTVNVTLDFGSYVMTVPASLEPTDNFMAILVDGSTLTVEGPTGGIVSGDAETCGVYGFNVKGGGKLVINGGSYYCGITVAQAQLGTIEVNGGNFAVNDANGKYPGYMFNCVDANYVAGTAGITVNGGTFVGYDPRNNAAEGANTSFVASGVGVDKNTGGTFTAKPGMVAQIVDANGNSVAAYATLAEAIAAAAKNSTVKLIADTRENVTIDKALTLDLNGKKLSTSKNANDNTKHYYAIDNYGTFTLRDSSAAQTGEIRARGIENLGSGKMVIESGKIVAIDTNGGAAIWNLADLTIQGGTFVAEHVGASGDQYGPGCVYNNGKLTINGGTFKSANKRTYAIVSKSGAVTITPAEGKTVEISGAHGGLGIDGGTAIINGGSYASDDYYGLYVSNDFETAEVTVTGGTFDGKEYSAFIGSDGSNSVDSKLIIKGGTFNKPIHAQDNTSKGAIQVSSGTFSSAVPKDYCAEFFKPVQNADGKYTVEKVKTNNVKINFGGTGGSQITVGVDGSISIINNHTQEFATGELVSLTATAQDNAKFLFWLDSNRRIVSTNATYQFYVDSDISVTAQFYTPAEGKRYVIFIDMDNHVAGYADVAFGSTVTAPDHLTFANRTFDGWYVDGHTNKYDVGASITVTKGDKDPLYVHAKYTATDTLIKVYIDDKLYGEFAYGSDVTVTADESTSDGKFAGWYIGDALVSTKREYSFRVASEVRLTKKYDVSGIESKAIINMFVADRTEENTIIVYEIRWELPENCKFTSGGLLLTKFRENADKLTVENKGAEGITHRSITSTASGLYKCTVKLSDASSTIYAKAYINYIDADGKVQTIYTDLYTSVGK